MRTLRECYRVTEEEIISQYSWNWMNSGTMRNGILSTARITEFPKTGSVCILSDILEDTVDLKYFLSKEQMERIVFQ